MFSFITFKVYFDFSNNTYTWAVAYFKIISFELCSLSCRCLKKKGGKEVFVLRRSMTEGIGSPIHLVFFVIATD